MIRVVYVGHGCMWGVSSSRIQIFRFQFSLLGDALSYQFDEPQSAQNWCTLYRSTRQRYIVLVMTPLWSIPSKLECDGTELYRGHR